MSGQAQGVRGAPLRGYRRRKAVLDLNVAPSEGRDDEGTSTQPAPAPVPAPSPAAQEGQASHQAPPTTIDVEALDDDVIVSSPRAFAEAKSNAQRTRERTLIVDVDSGRTTRFTHNNRNKRRRIPSNQTIINCDLYINLEGSSSSTRDNVELPPPPPPPPPKEPVFNCPICMGPFVEETSTRCGHIFCKKCIKSALAVQAKCPTCRKRVTVKELIRVFLPATSPV